MVKVLFICHGNICRSAAAEVVMRELAAEAGRRDLAISSAAATREEIGHDIYPPMKKALTGAGYVCAPHAARQTVRGDYQAWDYLIGMDEENLWDMKRIYGGDPEGKISLLRDWAGEPGGEIEDPWYTRNFSGVLRQIEEGCRGLLKRLGNSSADSRINRTETGKDKSGDGTIRAAVISDTHGLLRREVVAELQDCTHIIHAGDIIRETDLDELRLYGSIYAVRGNNDLWQEGLRDLAGMLRFEIGGVRFLMTHDRRDVPRDLTGIQAVICGHTHRYSEEWIDGRLWLNPGSCGISRFGSEITLAKMSLKDGRISRVQKIVLPDGM